jgi:O-antigen/teichoic acid export membrane protein
MIARQTALGGMLMVGARLATRVIDLATMLVLARLLRPTDFGLVAIAASAVLVIESALELPLNQALVRLEVISRAHYDTAFTLALLRASVLTAIILLIAWPFAWFYEDARLLPLVCVLAVGASARALTSPCLAEFQKTMSFWRDFVLELSGKAVGFAVGITTALVTGSYWSIAAGAVAYPLTSVIASYCFAPYRPRLDLSELPAFKGFLGWMSAAQMINALNWQSERLLLGKLQPTAALGLFTTASDISQMPVLALFGPLTRPLLAAFSLVRNDRPRLARSYQIVSSAIVTIGLPILVGECLLAEPAIRLVLGENWLAAAPLLQWLSLSMIPALVALGAIPLVMAFGDTKVFLKRNLLESCVKIPIVIVGGVMYGFVGIAVARVASESAAALFCIYQVRRLVGLSVREQLLGPWRSFVAVLVMAPPVILCARHLEHLQGIPGDTLQSATGLVASVAIGAVTYGAAMIGLWLLSGRPQSIESTAVGAVLTILARVRRPA